ncbi:MAG: ZIP family metal transporter [Candidatus Roizmanbacteria bacterium]|nr:MAG: ZIP family metal transporter [Candidatus Roizmanbacteria bacterium]
MITVWMYSIISVLLVSVVSLVGVLTLSINDKLLKRVLIYFVSFSTGALFGDAFIHILPEVVEEFGFSFQVSLFILAGIVVSFIIEKVICWRHCHIPITKTHVHRFAFMNLFGDAIHNLIDGLIIGASYLASIPLGIATTIAVIFHEIPQEIGDFGILLHGGFSKQKAILYNFFIALTAILGVVLSLLLSAYVENANMFLLPFAAGSFIYIAGSDLIPELHKEVELKKSLFQIIAFILGILVMLSLLIIE